MTQRQIWKEIAELFGSETEHGFETRKVRALRGTNSGLCRAYTVMTGTDAMYDYHGWMEDDDPNEPLFLASCCTPEGDMIRCLIACLFATMTAKERRAIGLPG